MGVVKQDDKYIAKITVNYKTHYLGYFETLDEAVKARREAEVKFGFDVNHNKGK